MPGQRTLKAQMRLTAKWHKTCSIMSWYSAIVCLGKSGDEGWGSERRCRGIMPVCRLLRVGRDYWPPGLSQRHVNRINLVVKHTAEPAVRGGRSPKDMSLVGVGPCENAPSRHCEPQLVISFIRPLRPSDCEVPVRGRQPC